MTGMIGGDFDYQVAGHPVDFGTMPYATTDQSPHEIQSRELG